jgi:hypothetical protein
MANDNILQEYNEFAYEVQELNEDGMPKKFRLKGIFQKCDTPNGNGRVYPKRILEGALQSTAQAISEGRMLGELDHPDDAKIHLDKVSHKITSLKIDPTNGYMMGEAEVLQTPAGKILEGLIKSGVKLGISSRGFGSVKDVNGLNEVQEDFKLVTFDMVSDPSTPGAFPNAVYEHKEQEVASVQLDEDFVTNLGFLVEEILEEDVDTPEVEKRYYVGGDEAEDNKFYVVEGERDSYGTLNFHMSHDYHILLKKNGEHERISINEENMEFVKRIYGEGISKKLGSKFTELGYNSKTLNLKKEEN